MYVLFYVDGKEYNGDRRMDVFRRFRVWRYFSPVQYTFADEQQLSLTGPSVKRMYVMVPGDTLGATVWTLGLHGGALNKHIAEKLCFVVPPLLLRIPLMRDVLLACGAVTYNTHSQKPLEDLLLEMIQSGRSVCFCPSRFGNGTLSDTAAEDAAERGVVQTVDVPEQVLSFARAEKLQLVPIIVQGERKRYHIITWPRVQRFFLKHLDYAFPQCVMPRFFARHKPPPLNVLFGPIIHCDEKYTSNADLRRHFREMVKQSTCAALGDAKIAMK